MTDRGIEAAQNAQILKAAREAIANETNWCQSILADYGEPTTKGNRVCAIGAVMKVQEVRVYQYGAYQYSAMPELTLKALRALAEAIAGKRNRALRDFGGTGDDWSRDIHRFNDSHTHSAVMTAFDKAIKQQCKIVREEAALEAEQRDLPLE